jgi:hypothetical protein
MGGGGTFVALGLPPVQRGQDPIVADLVKRDPGAGQPGVLPGAPGAQFGTDGELLEAQRVSRSRRHVVSSEAWRSASTRARAALARASSAAARWRAAPPPSPAPAAVAAARS